MDAEPLIRKLEPIIRLPDHLQDKAVAMATLDDHHHGSIVYRQDSNDDRVHYLIDGGLEFVWHGRVTRTLNTNHRTAAEPLDPPGRKRYTVRADGAARIASFKRVELDRLVEQFEREAANNTPEVAEIGTEQASDWMTRLLQSAVFSRLPATNIQAIFARMERLGVDSGEVIARQGEIGSFYYVIEQGYCEVSRSIDAGRKPIHLDELGPGTAFGE